MSPNKQGASLERESRALSGKTIVVTRPRSQAEAFVRGIEALGGAVFEFPTIEILPPENYESLDSVIRRIRSYDWIFFTSVNGVRYFWDRFRFLKRNRQDLEGVKIAVIGPETAKALEVVGLSADLVPEEYRAEGILKGLKAAELSHKRVLLPRAAEARDVLPKTLREWGADVDVIEVYRTVAAKSDSDRLRALLMGKKIDMITFTSSSTVTHFTAHFSREDLRQLLGHTTVACIGPITQKTAEDLGIRVDVAAQDYTIPGLTQAIVEYFAAPEWPH